MDCSNERGKVMLILSFIYHVETNESVCKKGLGLQAQPLF